jgi:serine/threonine protein kinase/dephospho-CoA kinase
MSLCPACKTEHPDGDFYCPAKFSAEESQPAGTVYNADSYAVGDPLIGRRLGHWILVRRIGEGGMGIVYAAKDPLSGAQVAVKVLRLDEVHRIPDPAFRWKCLEEAKERFRREAEVSRRLGENQPNIVQILGYGTLDDGRPYFVMEFLYGRSLDARMRQTVPPTREELRRWFEQACDALSVIHEAGVVHRDLKPDNIWISEPKAGKSSAKLLDFGISKVKGGTSLTSPGMIPGTALYLAPERLSGSSDDPRSDIYAMGVILHEVLSGRPPFDADTIQGLYKMILMDPPPPIRPKAGLTVSRKMERLILDCLAKDPEARPQTALDLRTRFLEALDGEEIAAPAGRVTHSPTQAPSVQLPRADTQADLNGAEELKNRLSVALKVPALSLGGAKRDTLASCVPDEMKSFEDSILAFLDALFADAQPFAKDVISLGRCNIAEAGQYAFFALFIPDVGAIDERAPLGHLETRIFIDRAAGLRRKLESLPRTQTKVVFVFASAADLSAGVQERVLEYRQQLNTLVLPIYVREIEHWVREEIVAEQVEYRLRDLHTLPDPYSRRALPSDPTDLVGLGPELNSVIAQIREQGGVISITGQPGCGKSALLHLAKHGCCDRLFVYVNAGNVPHRVPSAMSTEVQTAILKALGLSMGNPAISTEATLTPDSLAATIAKQPDHSDSSSARAPLIRETITSIPKSVASALPREQRRRLVLAIEDADWLIEMLCSPDTTTTLRQEVQAFWSALGEVARTPEFTVLVTSVRGFELADGVVAGWTNPVRPHAIAMRPLEFASLRHLITTLGCRINVRYRPEALFGIHSLTGGNIAAARLLCSAIVINFRSTPGYRALDLRTVGVTEVREAARWLVAQQSFGDVFLKWCNDVEHSILHYIANNRPRNLHRLLRGQEKRHPRPAVAAAVKTVQSMQLVEFTKRKSRLAAWLPFTRRRHRLAIGLLETWIRDHVELTETQTALRKDSGAKLLAIGISLGALVLGGHLLFVRPQRMSIVASEGACTFTVDYPELAAPGVVEKIHVFRQCSARPYLIPELQAVQTPAEIAQEGCDEQHSRCFLHASVTPLEIAGSTYVFQLVVAERDTLAFRLKKDTIPEARARLSQLVGIFTVIPPLLFGIAGYYNRSITALRRLLGGRGKGREEQNT